MVASAQLHRSSNWTAMVHLWAAKCWIFKWKSAHFGPHTARSSRLLESLVTQLLRYHCQIWKYDYRSILRTHTLRWVWSILWPQRFKWVSFALEIAYEIEIGLHLNVSVFLVWFRSCHKYRLYRAIRYAIWQSESRLSNLLCRRRSRCNHSLGDRSRKLDYEFEGGQFIRLPHLV